jgi:hypothetical protein
MMMGIFFRYFRIAFFLIYLLTLLVLSWLMLGPKGELIETIEKSRPLKDLLFGIISTMYYLISLGVLGYLAFKKGGHFTSRDLLIGFFLWLFAVISFMFYLFSTLPNYGPLWSYY